MNIQTPVQLGWVPGTLGTGALEVEQRIDFDAMRSYRLGRTKEQLELYDLGALLVFDPDNVRYITSTHIGEWARDKAVRWALLPRGGEPYLFEIGSAAEVKRRLAPWLPAGHVRNSTPWSHGGNLPEVTHAIVATAVGEIKGILDEHGVSELPIGIDAPDHYLLDAMHRAGLQSVAAWEPMFDARMIKSPDELKAIEISAAMVDGVYAHVVDLIKPGVRESEIVAEIYRWLLANGADRITGVNCVSGTRSNPNPHDYSDRMIRPGDLVFIDIVSHYLGYATCYYRTFAVTRATQRQRDVYARAYEWLQRSIDVVKPGITTADIAAQWPAAQEFGYANERDAFACQVGHGIGLSNHEKPHISRLYSLDHPIDVQAGMHFALETFYGEEDSGARLESQLVVTDTGHEVITKFPIDDLIVLAAI